ncbi:hypothetical protein [Paenibacillus sp. NRS-1760]|uniref:hypothetical protein n=1 Tax=Paenibacillus sp. NRS-1760 TaxID=3233902 RepID=UPI003D284993
MEQLFEEGIQAWSIRRDVDAPLLASTITHVMTGTLKRLTIRSDIYQQESKFVESD